MISRHLAAVLPVLAQGYPVLVLTGPRQAGKTTLARATFAGRPYVSLEDPREQAAFQADPRAWLGRYPDGAIIDEIQRCPDLPAVLQGVVDADARLGRWILTGSQQFMVMDRVTQSLAGRAALVELLPFSAAELQQAGRLPADSAEWIWKGGYPPIYDRPVEPDRWLGDYLATHLERDVRSILGVRDWLRFNAFLRLCATRIGQSVNLAAMAGAIGVDGKTAKEWLSVLAAGYVVHLLPPHHANLGKRVVKHPKLYLLDTGLACRLLGIATPESLRSHPSWGPLVENALVVEVLKARRHRGWRCDTVFWWRSHDGLEVDLVLDQGGFLHPGECKATTAPSPEDLRAVHRFTELAGPQARPGALFHLGPLQAEMAGQALVPWHRIDATVAAWGA